MVIRILYTDDGLLQIYGWHAVEAPYFCSMRSILVIIAIAVVTVVYATAVMIHMALFRDRDVFHTYARSWSRILLKLAGVRVELRGIGHLSVVERYIYVANHASLFDIPVLLAYVPDNIRIMYKRELGAIPIFGWCLRMSPFIPIDRRKSREAADALDAVVATMRDGASVVVFPEGTRSDDGRVGEFKRGAFTLAARSGKPLVPVALEGTAAIMPARGRRINPGTVIVHIERPVILPQPASRADEMQAMEQVRTMIAEHVTLQS